MTIMDLYKFGVELALSGADVDAFWQQFWNDWERGVVYEFSLGQSY